jgi:nitrite reductase (NO-forming)
MIGPRLGGIIGRKAGTEPGFTYSRAMKQASITWTPQTLAIYLADPQKAVPGNRMPFPGLKSAHDRDDMIAPLLQATGGTPAAASGALRSTPPTTPAPTAPPGAITDMPDVNYTLRTGIAEGRMVFLGVGGAIDGQVDPILTAAERQTVQVTLINSEGADHDVCFPISARNRRA